MGAQPSVPVSLSTWQGLHLQTPPKVKAMPAAQENKLRQGAQANRVVSSGAALTAGQALCHPSGLRRYCQILESSGPLPPCLQIGAGGGHGQLGAWGRGRGPGSGTFEVIGKANRIINSFQK